MCRPKSKKQSFPISVETNIEDNVILNKKPYTFKKLTKNP